SLIGYDWSRQSTRLGHISAITIESGPIAPSHRVSNGQSRAREASAGSVSGGCPGGGPRRDCEPTEARVKSFHGLWMRREASRRSTSRPSLTTVGKGRGRVGLQERKR